MWAACRPLQLRCGRVRLRRRGRSAGAVWVRGRCGSELVHAHMQLGSREASIGELEAGGRVGAAVLVCVLPCRLLGELSLQVGKTCTALCCAAQDRCGTGYVCVVLWSRKNPLFLVCCVCACVCTNVCVCVCVCAHLRMYARVYVCAPACACACVCM